MLVQKKLPEENLEFAGEYFETKLDELVHRAALEEKKRPDGRRVNELRPLFAQAG